MFPIERLKELIVHPDKYIRDEVSRYIGEERICDPEIIPLVVTACEKYGCFDCMKLLYSNHHQYISPQMAEKLLAMFENTHQFAKLHLAKLISHADMEFIKSHIEQMRQIELFNAALAEARIYYSDYSADDIWEELKEFAKGESCIDTYSQINMEHKDAIVERILSFGDIFDQEITARVSDIANTTDDVDDSEWVLNAIFIELAGERNLSQSIQSLNEIMKKRDWEVYSSCARDALSIIKSNEIFDIVKRDFFTQKWDYQLDVASILSSNMSDYAVDAIEFLLKQKPKYQNDIYGILCFDLCDQFSQKALPWGMTVIGDREIASYDNMKERLWNLSQILDANWTIVDKWEDEIKEKRERTERIIEHDMRLNESDCDETEWDQSFMGDILARCLEDRVPQKGVAKIGRNSPCPCGSNKKYKKCCGKNI